MKWCLYNKIYELRIIDDNITIEKIKILSKKSNQNFIDVLNDFGFRFVFHRNNISQNVTVNVSQNVTVKLIETDFKIFNLLKQNPTSTREVLANSIGKTVRTVQRSLDRLVLARKIIRIGSDKSGYWEIVEK